MRTRLVKDTIVVETADTIYLYAQATRKVVRVHNLCPEIQQELSDRGFFNTVPRSMHYRRPRKWTSLMLLMGKACPLSCLYCYAHGGRDSAMMKPEVADRAIATYLSTRPKRPKVTFFAGGEPALNVPAIKHVVAKYEDAVRWHMTTSGVLPLDWLEWLVEHQVGITVSIDGPPHIQDTLRPLRGGGKSSPIVERTIRTLVNKSGSVGVRATITKETLGELNGILTYFQSLGVRTVHIEGLYSLGRALESHLAALTPLTAEERTKLLLDGLDWAQANDRQVKMGSISYLLRPKVAGYCGAMQGQAMVVNHLGQLTACSEVVDESADEWSIFHIGQVNADGKLWVNRDKLHKLQQRVVTNMPTCRQCFARYLCRGGCPHKALAATGDVCQPQEQHCEFVRAVIPVLIQRMAEQAWLHYQISKKEVL
jgi:uncharacterized protein